MTRFQMAAASARIKNRTRVTHVAIAMCAAAMVVYALAYLFSDPLKPNALGPDANAYWSAAQRLREGQQLYPELADEAAASTYRYSPWFAVAWIPLTSFPKGLVIPAWTLMQFLAGAYLVVPLVRTRTLAAVLFLILVIPQMINQAWIGNVENLMLAAIAWSIDRRSGPLWIGLAGSLKVTPIAFVLIYLVRGQYRRACAAILIMLALWSMVLIAGASHYPLSQTGAIPVPTVVWLTLLAVSLSFAGWALFTGRLVGLAAAVVAIAASPRIHVSMVAYLLTGVRASQTSTRAEASRVETAASRG